MVSKKCIQITVYGKVQGVGYREFVKKHAGAEKIEGSIRNNEDGSVLILAAGDSDNLDNLIDYIYQGSPQSSVEEVAIEIATNVKDFRGVFRVIGG